MLPRRSDFQPLLVIRSAEKPRSASRGFSFSTRARTCDFMDFYLLLGMVVGLVFGIVTIVFVSTMR
jgi:hypothetical protein